MNPAPMELLERVKKVAPPEAEIVPLSWAYEDEDYNIAVVIPDAISYGEARQIEDRLIDVAMDYDEAHDTFTLCMVWREHEMTRPGRR